MITSKPVRFDRRNFLAGASALGTARLLSLHRTSLQPKAVTPERPPGSLFGSLVAFGQTTGSVKAMSHKCCLAPFSLTTSSWH